MPSESIPDTLRLEIDEERQRNLIRDCVRTTLNVNGQFGYDQDGQWHQPDNRPRKISPKAGHALEILGHSIDYLSDELIKAKDWEPSTLTAIKILIALNRDVYFECPIVPTWGERFSKLFRREICIEIWQCIMIRPGSTRPDDCMDELLRARKQDADSLENVLHEGPNRNIQHTTAIEVFAVFVIGLALIFLYLGD